MGGEATRFKKGISVSPATQFKKGKHWRAKSLYWNKEWLYNEYIINKRSSTDIAADFGITNKGIIFWLNKHGIKCRTTSETRLIKHWGQSGADNPMFGNLGDKNWNWKGGITADRPSLYASIEWKSVVKIILKKYNYKCDSCKNGHRHKMPLHIHHIVSFKVKSLRLELDNLVVPCKECHNFVHSKLNFDNNYILTHDQYLQKFK